MKYLLICTLSLISISVFAQIGEPFPMLEKEYGVPIRTWENISGLKEYVFIAPNLEIQATPINGLIQKISYEFSLDKTNDIHAALLALNGSRWEIDGSVSPMEFNDFRINPWANPAIKYIHPKTGDRAYFGTPRYQRTEHTRELHVFTDRYIKECARQSLDPEANNYTKGGRLRFGYQAGNTAPLLDWFNEMASNSIPRILNRELTPKAVSEAYEVFELFTSFSTNGPTHRNASAHRSRPFIVIQSSLNIIIRTSLEQKKHPYDGFVHPAALDITINDFRPNVPIQGMRVVYLDNLSEKHISAFLGEEQDPVGLGNIMNPAVARGESLKRVEYINNALYVYPGHWGGWHILSDPAVRSITFNEDLTVAWVDYSMGYEGGQTTYQKQHGEWSFISSLATWIE